MKKIRKDAEKMIANYLGWKQVSGSGSRPMHPGDVISEEWLGECKTHITSGQKIIFYFDVWDKLAEEAVSQFKNPVLFVDDGSQTIDKTFAMIEVADNLEIQKDIDDYSDKKSFRFDSNSIFESTDLAHAFLRDGKLYFIMWLPQFSQYLKHR